MPFVIRETTTPPPPGTVGGWHHPESGFKYGQATGLARMPTLRHQFEYNGLVLNKKGVSIDINGVISANELDCYYLTSVTGFSDGDRQDTSEPNSGSDGETPLSVIDRGRTIILEGYMETGSIMRLEDMWQALRTAFKNKDNRPLYIWDPISSSRNMHVMCHKVSATQGVESQDGMMAKRDFMITLRAPNHDIYGDSRVLTHTLTGSPVTSVNETFSAQQVSPFKAPNRFITDPLNYWFTGSGGLLEYQDSLEEAYNQNGYLTPYQTYPRDIITIDDFGSAVEGATLLGRAGWITAGTTTYPFKTRNPTVLAAGDVLTKSVFRDIGITYSDSADGETVLWDMSYSQPTLTALQTWPQNGRATSVIVRYVSGSYVRFRSTCTADDGTTKTLQIDLQIVTPTGVTSLASQTMTTTERRVWLSVGVDKRGVVIGKVVKPASSTVTSPEFYPGQSEDSLTLASMKAYDARTNYGGVLGQGRNGFQERVVSATGKAISQATGARIDNFTILRLKRLYLAGVARLYESLDDAYPVLGDADHSVDFHLQFLDSTVSRIGFIPARAPQFHAYLCLKMNRTARTALAVRLIAVPSTNPDGSTLAYYKLKMQLVRLDSGVETAIGSELDVAGYKGSLSYIPIVRVIANIRVNDVTCSVVALNGVSSGIGSVTQTITLSGSTATEFGAGVERECGFIISQAIHNYDSPRVLYVDNYTVQEVNNNPQVFDAGHDGNSDAVPIIEITGPMKAGSYIYGIHPETGEDIGPLILAKDLAYGQEIKYNANTGDTVDENGSLAGSYIDDLTNDIIIPPFDTTTFEIIAGGWIGGVSKIDVKYKETWR